MAVAKNLNLSVLLIVFSLCDNKGRSPFEKFDLMSMMAKLAFSINYLSFRTLRSLNIFGFYSLCYKIYLKF